MRKTICKWRCHALPMVTGCGHTSSAAQEAPWREASETTGHGAGSRDPRNLSPVLSKMNIGDGW